MKEIRELILSIAPVMTVSGFEGRNSETIDGILKDHFDEIITEPSGSKICIKRCGKENAPKIMLDAHIDEVGFMVREICRGGFIRIVPIGGIDSRIMAASEVWIYGKKKILGIVVSTPPHLQKPGDGDKLVPVQDMLIDTGYSEEELNGMVKIGDPIGYKTEITDLLNDKIAGKGFDDKSCVSIIVRAVDLINEKINQNAEGGLDFDIYAAFSSHEETDMLGAKTVPHKINPDAAIALDVNFALQDGVEASSSGKMGGGPLISLSAVTDRVFTDSIIDFAEEKGIETQLVVEAMSTGTDANAINTTREGIPTAVISLPLRNMHTASEVISLRDAESTAHLLCEYIYSGGLEKWYRN